MNQLCLVAVVSLFFEQDGFYCNPAELGAKENGGVAVVRGRRVGLDNGMTVTYDKCLIATGTLSSQILLLTW